MPVAQTPPDPDIKLKYGPTVASSTFQHSGLLPAAHVIPGAALHQEIITSIRYLSIVAGSRRMLVIIFQCKAALGMTSAAGSRAVCITGQDFQLWSILES